MHTISTLASSLITAASCLLSPVHTFDVQEIVNTNKHSSYIFNQLVADRKSTDDLNTFSKNLFLYYKNNHIEYSQSEAHMLGFFDKKHFLLKKSPYAPQYQHALSNPHFRTLIYDLIQLEKQEQRKGRYTLVHGQPWFLQFYQDLYLFLWQQYFKKQIAHPFVFLRFRNVHTNLKDSIAKEKNIRKNLIKNGINTYYYSKKDQTYLVFLNYAFFANQWGSSTARYTICGYGENQYKIDPFDIQYIFNCFDYNAIYQKYKNDLLLLQAEHTQLNNYGCLLLFSIQPDHLNTITYLSYTGRKNEFSIPGLERITTPKQLLEVLRSKPLTLQDRKDKLGRETVEFALVATIDRALNPSDNMHVHTLIPIDPSVWQTYSDKKDALFAAISQEIGIITSA